MDVNVRNLDSNIMEEEIERMNQEREIQMEVQRLHMESHRPSNANNYDSSTPSNSQIIKHSETQNI